MATAAERANSLVDKWLQHSWGIPITLCLDGLALAIATAIDEAEQAAYERGLAEGTQQAGQEAAE